MERRIGMACTQMDQTTMGKWRINSKPRKSAVAPLLNRARWFAVLLVFPLIGGCQSSSGFFGFLHRTPTHVAVAMMNNPIFPDKRREGINDLVETKIGKRPPYTGDYVRIAKTDQDYTVRSVAIRALNRSRDASATAIFINGLSDPDSLVRLEAAKALNRLPDPAAVPLLIQHLQPSYATGTMDDRGLPVQQDETQDVRIAAAQALGHYKQFAVARALIDVLDTRDFGIAWQARKSLLEITGKDFGYDQTAWLDYLSSSSQPLG